MKVTAIEFDGDGGYHMGVGTSGGKVCILWIGSDVDISFSTIIIVTSYL